MDWDLLYIFIIGLGFFILKFVKIVGKIKIKKKKDWDDMAADVAQCERKDIKRYASAFNNI